METILKEVVLPGEIVNDGDIEKANNLQKVTLGPGLKRMGDDVVVSRAGILKKKERTIWVVSHGRRYLPTRGEHVLGTVVKKQGDYFKIDIGTSQQANLHYLSFENASKKNRPNLNEGDIVFSVLTTACPDMEPELECVNKLGKSDGLGSLPDSGFLLNCSLHLVRKILNPRCSLLLSLGKRFKYESRIGMNGRVWIKGLDMDSTITIANAILAAENKTIPEIEEYCSQFSLKSR